MKITTRTEAINCGQRTYFTGKPCKNGHIAQRYTMTSLCFGCANMRAKEQRQKTMMLMQSAQPIPVMMHPGDRAQVQEFATLLAAARGMVIYGIPDAPGRVSTHVAPGPKPQPPAPYVPAEFRNLVDNSVKS